MLIGGQTTEFHMNAILPIASYTNGVGFPILFAYRPKATLFAGEACETNRSLVRTESSLEDSRNSSVALFAAISQVSTWCPCASGHCVGVRQAMALVGDAMQATSEGKSGPVETRLTGPAATAPSTGNCICLELRKNIIHFFAHSQPLSIAIIG